MNVQYLFKILFLVLLDIHTQGELLVHVVIPCVVFSGSTIAAVTILHPINSAPSLRFPHVLASPHYFLFLAC